MKLPEAVLDENDTESAQLLVDELLLRIEDTSVVRGTNQKYADPARKKLRAARQMIELHGPSISFVIHDDVIDIVKSRGVTDQAQAEKMAQNMWKDNCFTLAILRSPEGEERTRAEFIHNFLLSGYGWKESFDYSKRFIVSSEKRDLPQSFRGRVINLSRENAVS